MGIEAKAETKTKMAPLLKFAVKLDEDGKERKGKVFFILAGFFLPFQLQFYKGALP